MRKNLLLLFFALVIAQGFAQNLSRQNWYFGNSNNAIRFNRSTNAAETVTNKAVPFGTGGSAVATDPATANLFFYTDGVLVYDAYHLLMPGTTGLTGNTAANQPVAITPIPGNANKDKYFIFTNSADFTTGGSVSYLVIDMNQFGNATFPAPARGAGEGTVNAVPGLSNRSEGMIVVPHSNGDDFWLITHQVNSQNYSATLINAASYTGTFTTTTTSGIGLPTAVASFNYNPASKKVAVAPQDPNTDAIILNFDNTTGVLSFDRTIFNTGVNSTTSQSVYDIEWSPSGRFLYLSRFGETGINADVLQYDYLNPTTTLATVLPSPVFRSYGLQLAPDRSIYHLYQSSAAGPFLAGSITQPDSVATAVNYTPSLFSNTDFKGTQFPSFSPPDTVDLQVNFTFIGTCQNSPTTFFPDVQPAADSLVWDFGDGSDTSAWSPVHTYAQAQTFNVKLRAYYQGQKDSVTLPVTITAFPLQLQLVQDTTACRSEFPPPRGSSSPTQFSVKVTASGGTPTSYTWSNGDIGQTLTPDSAGYYYVVVTDASGCSAYAGVNVKEYGLQDQTFNKWYFGNKAGIDFNVSPPKALNESAMNAPEGCAIVCDKNGRQIFYTDGNDVFNRNQQLIDTGIGGDPASSQSAIIIPVPGDETLYYIFTTQAIDGTSQNEVRYSLFDLKENNGLGAVVKKNVLLFSKSTERLTANGQWLIVHEWGNNTFRAYSISANGIGEAVYSSIGSDHAFTSQQNGEGYMKLGPRNNLAVALSTPGSSNLVELFHLNDSTGTIDNYRKIDLKETNGQVYGVEFSPAGNKLFATIKGPPSKLYEYSIDSVNQPHFKQVIQGAGEFGALQRGPDGQIYMAINSSTVLGTIAPVDDTTRVSSFNASGFNLAGGTNSTLGLPNFIQINSNALGGPSITVAGICTNDSTTISGSSRDVIDEFNWQVRQGNAVMATSKEESFKFLFTTAGVYTISLRLHNRCAADTILTKDVTIFNPPATPGGAAPLCTGAVTLDANPPDAPSLTYLWSTGATTETIQVTKQSIVTVRVADANSCVSNGSFIVADNRPKIDLGPDITLCENTNTPALDALNRGANYQWTIDGVNSSTTQTQPVTTSVPGVFTYAVTVTDPITTCSVTDDKKYTINTSPDFTLTGANPAGACGSATGSITLQINPTTPVTGPYSYFLTGPSTSVNGFDAVAPFPLTLPNKAAGTYSVVVSDQVSGCTLSSSFGLSDAAVTVAATPNAPNCDPVIVHVVTSGGATAPLNYTITNGATIVTGPTPQASTAFDATPGLSQGTYTIEIKDASGCIATTNIDITPGTPIPVILTPNICATPASINAAAAATFSWTGPGIVGGATTADVQINPGQGQFTYTVVATPTTAGVCPNTQSITVDIDNAVTPQLVQSDACQNIVTLSVTPTGNYTYRWFRDGTFQPTLGGPQTTISDPLENGHTYQVSIVNTVNGCVYPSNNLVVQITGPVTAALTTTPPCEDGQPFTLTAATNASSPTYVWSVNNMVINGATTSTLSQTGNGVYKVVVSQASCSATASINVTKSPVPAGNLPDRVIICNDPDNKDEKTNHVDLDPGMFTSYNWIKDDRTLNYTDQVLTATLAGIYEVELTNSFACKAKDQTDVRNECIPKLVAPNAFRPGSKVTENQNFFVLSFFITEDFEVFIYNRWGEMVFQSNDRHFKWNGSYNNSGALLPGGTYAYVIRYVSAFRPDQGKQEQRGGVSLLR